MIVFPRLSSQTLGKEEEEGEEGYDPALTRWMPFPPLERDKEGRVPGMRTKEVDASLVRTKSKLKPVDGPKSAKHLGSGSSGLEGTGRKIDVGAWNTYTDPDNLKAGEAQEEEEWTIPYTVALAKKDEEIVGFARGRVGLFVGESFRSPCLAVSVGSFGLQAMGYGTI
jgi:hypothetical protein